MSKAPKEMIDDLLDAVKGAFPDEDLLHALAEPGAIDDVPEGTLRMTTETFQRMPDGQRLLLNALRRLGEVQAQKGHDAVPLDGERAALAESLRREVEAYCIDRALTGAALAPEVLTHLTDAQLTNFTAQITRLRVAAREQLLALLEADDRAEAREAEFDRMKAAMAERREALSSKLHELRAMIETQRHRAREQAEARRTQRDTGRQSTPEVRAARQEALKARYDAALQHAIEHAEKHRE